MSEATEQNESNSCLSLNGSIVSKCPEPTDNLVALETCNFFKTMNPDHTDSQVAQSDLHQCNSFSKLSTNRINTSGSILDGMMWIYNLIFSIFSYLSATSGMAE